MAVYTGVKWGGKAFGSAGGTVTWSFATSQGSMLSFDGWIWQASFQEAVRRAFEEWDVIADIEFQEVSDAYSSDIRLGWTNIDGPSGILGTAAWQYAGTTLVRAEINFDVAESWGSTFSFSDVALHEIGHAIGLGHVDDTGSIMNAYSTKSGLSQQDKDAAMDLYGPELFRVDAIASLPFDPLEYIASHVDLIAHFGVDAVAGGKHYIRSGRDAGREVTFDGLEYIASYSDLIQHFGTNEGAATKHYIRGGQAAGRDVSFDALQYIASHDDLLMVFGLDAEAGVRHYIKGGHRVGRTADDFDAEQYLANYSDLQRKFGSDTEAATRHYIDAGFWAGRTDEFLIPDDGGSIA